MVYVFSYSINTSWMPINRRKHVMSNHVVEQRTVLIQISKTGHQLICQLTRFITFTLVIIRRYSLNLLIIHAPAYLMNAVYASPLF